MKPITLYIDPTSHHFLDDRLFVLNDGRLNGDHMNAPYVHLRDYLAARNIAVHTADRLPPENERNGKNIYVSMGMFDNYPSLAKRPDIIMSAFFAMECPIVEPSLYRELNRAQTIFKRIFSWSDSASLEHFVGGPLRCRRFCWPQAFDDVHSEIWGRTGRKFLVMINSNKLPRLYLQELYTERLRALEFFGRTDEIDLYGNGWAEPSWQLGRTWVPYTFILFRRELLRQWQRLRPNRLLEAARRVYRGHAASKSETLGQYTFALCFENMRLKGWITEKIFDCFFAGTVPIYWGAPDIEESIPPKCFIDMRRFSDYRELRDFLKSLSPENIRAYRDAARAFICSPRFYPFSKRAFAELFARMIEEDAGVRI